jgi:hypothetical protein
VADRTFTPAEANSALLEVRPVAERLVALRERMRELEREASELTQAVGGNGGGYAASDLRRAGGELHELGEGVAECMRELEEIGVHLKDLDVGLLDFPTLREGQAVLLCWHVGEERVSSWHGLEEGFAGRKPIDWGEEGGR